MPKASAFLGPDDVKRLTQAVFRCGTRNQLDALTRRIWREHDRPENAVALERLKVVIIARWRAFAVRVSPPLAALA
jgi:hypothetical protein